MSSDQSEKPKQDAVIFQMAADSVVVGIEYQPSGGVRIVTNEGVVAPASASFLRTRERLKSPKVLVRTPLDPDQMTISEADALMGWDRIFALDTNTRAIEGRAVSVTAVVECRMRRNGDDGRFEWLPLRLFEMHDVVGSAERLSWRLLIHAVVGSPDYMSGQRILILTDSELGKHTAINRRTEPCHGDEWLPDGFALGYGSGESGGSLAVRAVRACDSLANELLKQLTADPVRLQRAHPCDTGTCSHFSHHLINGAECPVPGCLWLGSVGDILFTKRP